AVDVPNCSAAAQNCAEDELLIARAQCKSVILAGAGGGADLRTVDKGANRGSRYDDCDPIPSVGQNCSIVRSVGGRTESIGCANDKIGSDHESILIGVD